MKIKAKYVDFFFNGGKVPRKYKKRFLSPRISSCKLNRKIQWWLKHGEAQNTFCPKCGESAERFVRHEVEYPEIWSIGYCLRCGNKTSEADNSPWYHVLEDMREDLLTPTTHE